MFVSILSFGIVFALIYKFLPRYALRPLYFVRENLTPTTWSIGAAILLIFYVQFALPVVVAPLVKPIGIRLFPEEPELRPRAQQIIPLEDDQIASDPKPSEEEDDSPENVASDAQSDLQQNDTLHDTEADSMATEEETDDADKTELVEESLQTLDPNEKNNAAPPRARPTEHPMARLLIRTMGTNKYPLILILFILCVCILAPLSEELCYRVVLQCAVERGLYDLNPNVRKLRAVVAVLAPALFFALLHFNIPEKPGSPEPNAVLFTSLLGTTIMDFIILLTVPLALRKGTHAGLTDLGLEEFTAWRPGARLTVIKRTLDLFLRGVCYLLLIFIPVQFINIWAQLLLPHYVIAPIPIFLFAIFQGIAYMRGRSFAYVVGSHMALNTISTLTLLLLHLN